MSLNPVQKLGFTLFFLALISKVVFFATHVPFAQDQVRDVFFIRELISQGNYVIPFGPSTSVGSFSLPPLYYYLHLFAHLLFFQKFYAMDVFVMLIESFTPPLIFLITYKLTRSRQASFGAGLIYLFSVGVLGASGAWNPNLVPFFSTAFFYSFLLYFLEKKSAWSLGAFLSFAVLVNLHFQWFLLIPFFVILFVHACIQWRETWKYLLAFIVGSLALFSPYLWQEFTTDFANTKQAIGLVHSDEVIFERIRKPAYVTLFFPNFYQRMLFGDLFVDSWEKQYEKLQPATVVGSVAFMAMMVYLLSVARAKVAHDKNYFLAVYLALFISMALFLRLYKGDKPDYYIYVMLSFFPVFLSVAFERLARNKKTVVQLLPFAVVILLELIANLQIPRHNDYHSLQSLTNRIKETSRKFSVVVEPANQEIVIPFSYFLSEDFFDIQKKDTAQYYILACYSFQNCQEFQPNTHSPKNLIKYNHIDPIDYSHTWEGYDPSTSFTVNADRYTALFNRVNDE